MEWSDLLYLIVCVLCLFQLTWTKRPFWYLRDLTVNWGVTPHDPKKTTAKPSASNFLIIVFLFWWCKFKQVWQNAIIDNIGDAEVP